MFQVPEALVLTSVGDWEGGRGEGPTPVLQH